MTGPLLRMDIRGRDGVALQGVWAAGPRNYLGLQVAGFPNLFTITGPGSPSVLCNMPVAIEQHAEWITDCIAHMRDERARAHRGDAGGGRDLGRSRSTRPPTRRCCRRRSIPGTSAPTFPASRVCSCPMPAAWSRYREICEEVAARGYDGFALS